MADDYYCLVHGLVLASEVALPVPTIDPRPADIRYRVALGTTVPAPSESRCDDPDDPWAIERWIDRRVMVEFPGRATFELSRSEVVLVADNTDDAGLTTHLLLDHVLPRVVALRGDLMLHAAGVVGPSGKAHLFLGKTGAGKSTIATALAADGWALLDDDGIRLTSAGGAFHAMPGSAAVHLLPDSAAALMPGAAPGRPISTRNPKRRFALDAAGLRMALGAAPVAGLYLLAGADASQPSLERLGFAAALTTITEHGFHLAEEPALIARQAFEHASALASAAPVWRLLLPAGLDRLLATRALIAELDRGT